MCPFEKRALGKHGLGERGGGKNRDFLVAFIKVKTFISDLGSGCANWILFSNIIHRWEGELLSKKRREKGHP